MGALATTQAPSSERRKVSSAQLADFSGSSSADERFCVKTLSLSPSPL